MSDWRSIEHVDVRRTPKGTGALWLAVIVLAAALLWTNRGVFAPGPIHQTAKPRPIQARGNISAEEQANIELFQRCSSSVVYVSPLIRRVERTFFGYRNLWAKGTGSGFVWDDRGYIVTNYHVVQEAESLQVTLPDNTTYDATLVGTLPDKDTAVLRIDAPPSAMKPIPIGRSNDLRVGQKVYAIGNPFGLDFTLTTGIISALDRQIETFNGRTIQGVIQTDAAINPGNSGGPLLDSAGRLIGMNTAIYSASGSSAGIGFAIPVDTINRIVPQLIADGRVTRPGLGVHINDTITGDRGIPGVLIVDVGEGSSAQTAGLRPTSRAANGQIVLGDIILKVGETPTPSTDALMNALERYAIGDTVEVTVLRGDSKIVVPVTLQEVR